MTLELNARLAGKCCGCSERSILGHPLMFFRFSDQPLAKALHFRFVSLALSMQQTKCRISFRAGAKQRNEPTLDKVLRNQNAWDYGNTDTIECRLLGQKEVTE